jgi:hypothetical protein
MIPSWDGAAGRGEATRRDDTCTWVQRRCPAPTGGLSVGEEGDKPATAIHMAIPPFVPAAWPMG